MATTADKPRIAEIPDLEVDPVTLDIIEEIGSASCRERV